jgi:hypothetical protein
VLLHGDQNQPGQCVESLQPSAKPFARIECRCCKSYCQFQVLLYLLQAAAAVHDDWQLAMLWLAVGFLQLAVC